MLIFLSDFYIQASKCREGILKESIFIALMLLGMSSSAFAARVQGGFPACADKKTMDEFIKASVRGDKQAINHLIGRTCIYTDSITNKDVTVLSSGAFNGLSEIKIYMDGGALKLVVPSDAIKK